MTWSFEPGQQRTPLGEGQQIANLCQEARQVPEQVAESWIDPEELEYILVSQARELVCAQQRAVARLGPRPRVKLGADWVDLWGCNPSVAGKQGCKSQIILLLYIVLIWMSGVSQGRVQGLKSVWDPKGRASL